MSKVVAIIPARAGSKRLPNKNKKMLCGKPLIQWTIEAALAAKSIDAVLVSTDCPQIAAIAESLGATVPGLRPAHLSTDNASSNDVISHITQSWQPEYETIVLLQPTSPLRTAGEVDEAYSLYISKKALGVVSVTPCDHSPLWSNTLPQDHSMADFIRPEILGKRSQDLPPFWRLNGAIYIHSVADIKANAGMSIKEGVYAYIMDSESSVDIDVQLDFDFAELLLKRRIKFN